MSEAPSGYINAKWVGPFNAHLPDRTLLVVNETVVAIPRGEAEASDHWAPQGGKVTEENVVEPAVVEVEVPADQQIHRSPRGSV